MLRAPHLGDYSDIIRKVRYLIDALHAEEQRHNVAADTVDHNQLRDSIRALAQQNGHYAKELQSQLYIIGAQVESDVMDADAPGKIQPPVRDTTDHVADPDREEIIRRCCDSEKDIIDTYRDILEGSLSGELRNVLRYQLDGMFSGFSQLELLRSTLNLSQDNS